MLFRSGKVHMQVEYNGATYYGFSANTDIIAASVEAFVEGDEANAQKVVEHDDVVDDLFNDMKKEMMQAIREQNLDADRVVDYLMMAKYLEKVGDHAVNIAEWVVFSVTGVHKTERIM